MASKPSKRRRGRSGIVEKPETFRTRCEAYFEQLHEDNGKTLRKEPTAPTIARLALFVGFNHVQTFHDQADRGDEFPQSSGFLAQEGTPLIRNAI